MTDDKQEEMLFQINGKLCSIDSKLDSLSETILKHESRLCTIEQTLTKHLVEAERNKTNVREDCFKTDMLRLLTKALIIAITCVASMCGAGSLLCKIWGN